MAKIALTDRFIKSRKPAPLGQRLDYADALVPGLGLRVTDRGHRSFVLVARYPSNPKNPTRRALGDYGELTLEQARDRARQWLALLQAGTDPRVDQAKQAAKAKRQQVNTFEHVAAEFLSRYVKGPAYCELERLAAQTRAAMPALKPRTALRQVMADPAHRGLVERSGREGLSHKQAAESIIAGEFVKRWKARPIVDIRSEECAEAIRVIVNRGTPYQAHGAFEWLRRLFNWAVGTNEFGITASPVATLRPSDLIGKKQARDRMLLPAELKAVWEASAVEGPSDPGKRTRATWNAGTMAYPYGGLIRLLILTGQREREVADARWSEIDLQKKLWTIPASRMKGQRVHEVPLAPLALALLKALPRFTGGDYLFTTTGGSKPVSGFSKAKRRVDKLSGVTEWRFHDLRRTMRTHLSALPVEDLVRELVIAHARPGLHKVYDQHSYQDEKRRCLELWEKRLAGLLAPKPAADVANIQHARNARAEAAL